MSDLYNMISASADGQETTSPEPQAEPDGGGGEFEQPSGVAETAPPSGQDVQDELLGDKFDWNTLPQELLPLAKGLQGSYTRRMQELAEQRKQAEALRLQDTWRSAEQLIEEDPARAAVWFRQQAELLAGGATGQQQAEIDPYAELVPATDVEAALLKQLQQLEQQQRGLVEWQQQQQVAYQQQQISREFSDLEKAVGRTIPEAERQQIASFCVQNQIANVSLGYRALKYDADLQAARQAGVNQGATALQQKQQMAPPPSSMVSRATGENSAPQDLRSVLNASYDALAAG